MAKKIGRAKGIKENKPRARTKPSVHKLAKTLPKANIAQIKKDVAVGAPPRFKKGNNLWTKRSKHGVEAVFNEPEVMLRAFQEYMDMCIENPWYKVEVVKGIMLHVPTVIPYSLGGFMIFCGTTISYWAQFKTKKTAAKPGFDKVIEVIEQTIREQKFTGAAVGAFNANIMSRDLGLIDKHEATVTQKQDVANLFPTEEEFEQELKNKSNEKSVKGDK